MMTHEIVLEMVKEIRKDQPKAGTPQLWRTLKPHFEAHGIKIGRAAINSLLRDNGLLIKPKRIRARTTFSEHGFKRYPNLIKDIEIIAPEQVWVSDITYVPLINGGFVYLFLLTDAYSRMIMGWHLSATMEAENAIITLEKAIAIRSYAGKNTIHHSDQGTQYSCPAYTKKLKENKFQISMAGRGRSYENPIAERANGIVKVDLGCNRSYENLEQARIIFEQIIHTYNFKRLHSSCNYLTPFEAHKQSGTLKRHWKNNRRENRQPLSNQSV